MNNQLELKFVKYGRKKDIFSMKSGIMKWCVLEHESGQFRLECYMPENQENKDTYISVGKKE